MITKHGKAAHCTCDCPSFSENTAIQTTLQQSALLCEQVLNLGVFLSHRFLFHRCTQDLLVAHTHDLDAPFQRDTCARLSL